MGREPILAAVFLLFACAPPPSDGPPNLLLVSLDGVAAFRTHLGGGDNPNTPTLDRLAAEGRSFPLAFSQSNESLFSHASMFSGRYPSEIAVPTYAAYSIPDDAVLVSEILPLYGYTTGAFVAGGHVKGAYGFDEGFAVYEDDHDFGALFHTVPEALDWLEEVQEPWFLVLHGYDVHRPYQKAGVFAEVFGEGPSAATLRGLSGTDRVYQGRYYPDFSVERITHVTGDPIVDPEGYLRIARWAEGHDGEPVSSEDIAAVGDSYDAAVLAADLQLGRFLEEAGARGQLDRTLVIATADHGEDLHVHGLFNHRALLRDSTTRVPLVLWGEGVEQGVDEGLAAAVDIVPTLLGAAGAVPPAGVAGRDLLSAEPAAVHVFQESVMDELSVRSQTHRLVFRGVPPAFDLLELALAVAPMQAPHFALYDLRNDPDETTDVLAAQLEVAEELRAAMLRWHRGLSRGQPGSVARDPELLQALRARGYW